MDFIKVVGIPSKYMLVERGEFQGEGTLVELKVLKAYELSDGLVECSVQLRCPLDDVTKLWLVGNQVVHYLNELQSSRHPQYFITNVTKIGSLSVLEPQAIVLDGEPVRCYLDKKCAMKAVSTSAVVA